MEICISPGLEGGDLWGSSDPWVRLVEAFQLTLLDQMLVKDLFQYAGEGRDQALAVVLAALLRTNREGHLCLELMGNNTTCDGAGFGELADLRPWEGFERMHRLLDPIWQEVHRILKPGGLACINIGDATRTIDGGFTLFTNHARILRCMIHNGFTPCRRSYGANRPMRPPNSWARVCCRRVPTSLWSTSTF